jgi:hypothetical protein
MRQAWALAWLPPGGRPSEDKGTGGLIPPGCPELYFFGASFNTKHPDEETNDGDEYDVKH